MFKQEVIERVHLALKPMAGSHWRRRKCILEGASKDLHVLSTLSHRHKRTPGLRYELPDHPVWVCHYSVCKDLVSRVSTFPYTSLNISIRDWNSGTKRVCPNRSRPWGTPFCVTKAVYARSFRNVVVSVTVGASSLSLCLLFAILPLRILLLPSDFANFGSVTK